VKCAKLPRFRIVAFADGSGRREASISSAVRLRWGHKSTGSKIAARRRAKPRNRKFER